MSMSSLWSLWSDSLRIRHSASIFSLALWFQLAYLVSIVLVPFFVAYACNGLWKKTDIYYEQPIVIYQKRLIVQAEGADTFMTWSTLPEWNAVQPYTRPMTLKSSELDTNRDGRVDQINIGLTIPMSIGETIQRLTLLLFCQVTLVGRVNLQMQSVAVYQSSTAVPSRGLMLNGDLLLHPLNPIPSRGHRTSYNTPLLDPRNITSIEDASIERILRLNFLRNDTLLISSPHSFWLSGTDTAFNLTATLRIPTQSVTYIPGPAELLTFSWSIYLPLALLWWWFASCIRNFVFRHQILQTVIRRDTVPVHKAHQF